MGQEPIDPVNLITNSNAERKKKRREKNIIYVTLENAIGLDQEKRPVLLSLRWIGTNITIIIYGYYIGLWRGGRRDANVQRLAVIAGQVGRAAAGPLQLASIHWRRRRRWMCNGIRARQREREL